MINSVYANNNIPLQDGQAPRMRTLQTKSSNGLPTLSEFTATVMNGNTSQVVGVYVPEKFALPIVQQPSSNPAYVPNQRGVAAQFGMAADYNTIAFLAHNTLSGEEFFKLERFQEVNIIYGDGSQQTYVVTSLAHYQALSPNSPHSNFLNIDKPEEPTLSASEVFTRIYMPGKRVVFQTCIQSGNEASWGRLFVTAVPQEKPLVAYNYESFYNYGRFSRVAWAN